MSRLRLPGASCPNRKPIMPAGRRKFDQWPLLFLTNKEKVCKGAVREALAHPSGYALPVWSVPDICASTHYRASCHRT